MKSIRIKLMPWKSNDRRMNSPALGGHIRWDAEAVPFAQKPLKDIMERYEKQIIFEVLEQVEGNRVKAAKVLGIGRKTLYEKLDRYGLK